MARSEHAIPSDALWPSDAASLKTRSIALPVPLMTELVWLNCSTLPPGSRSRLHVHPFHQFDVILQGSVEPRAEGLPGRQLQAGDALIVPPLIRHGNVSARGFRHISFKVFLAPRATTIIGDAAHVTRLPKLTVEQLKRAGEQFVAGDLLGIDAVMAAGTLALAELMRTIHRSNRAAADYDRGDFRRLVLPVLQRVEETSGSGWSVAEMAAACSRSGDHFSKCFHRLMGSSPAQYLLECRIRRAASELLVDPTRPVKQIAQQLGYSSVQTFGRAFKSILGVSPMTFRQTPRVGSGTSQYRLTFLD